MIASLQMYQRAELEEAHDRFWSLIRKNLAKSDIDAPENLSQNAHEMDVWKDDNLVLSQTCAMPYRKFLGDHVTLIGTPDYAIKDCLPGYYKSAFIVNVKDKTRTLNHYKNSIFCYNDINSQSGYHVAENLFENAIDSGSHINSAKMVATGQADIAAIDAVSLSFMADYDDFYHDLKILCWSKPTPGLPYISAKNVNREIYFKAVSDAIRDLEPEFKNKLKLKDFVYIPPQQYRQIT